jgi:hypothetical protein
MPSTQEKPRRTIGQQFRIAVIVSAIYVWAYFATVYFIAPIQSRFLPAVTMSVLFLPHGLRVLTAWLYGWRSSLFLAPGALACNLHFAGPQAFDLNIVLGTVIGLLSAPFAFTLARAITLTELRPHKTSVSALLAVGVLASFVNFTGLGLVRGFGPIESAVTFIGDINGLLLSIMIVGMTISLLQKSKR